MSYQTFLFIFFVVGFIHETIKDFFQARRLHEDGAQIVGSMVGSFVWNGVKYGTITLCLVKGGFFDK